MGGVGSFVMEAQSFESFGQAIINKLVAEIAAAPPAAQAGAAVTGNTARFTDRAPLMTSLAPDCA